MMKFKISILFLILLCGLSAHKNHPKLPGQNPLSENNKKNLLNLVNDARSKGCNCGNQKMPPVAAVTWNKQLEAASIKHSQDMYENRFMRHSGSDGSTFSARITKEGFKWTSCAENIAEGYETEQQVVDGWLKSPEHCKNLMSPRYQFMGVARVGTYWTQDFAGK